MFGYNLLAVIRRRDDTGIIAKIEGHMFTVMFESAGNGVEFINYPLSMISKYAVIG